MVGNSKRLQLGLGLLASLIVIAIAAGAAYYIYLGVTGEDAVATCKSELGHCMKKCRRTSKDSDAAQACQKSCQREAYLCEGLKR